MFTRPQGSIIQLVPSDISSIVQTDGKLETSFIQMGNFDVSFMEQNRVEDLKKIIVYYPSLITESKQKFPVIVMANGTWAEASKYTVLFKHLASWGFIVVGNEAKHSWDGIASERSLQYILSLNNISGNLFSGKIDTNNIGICGHSQGGVGVFNAITLKKECPFKTAISLSPVNQRLAAKLKWKYDLTKISIPILIIAGTNGLLESKVISPLNEIKSIYNAINTPKVMMLRRNATHWNMLYHSEGYVTAWMMWQLKGDITASMAFTGEYPEIMDNTLYSYQQILLHL